MPSPTPATDARTRRPATAVVIPTNGRAALLDQVLRDLTVARLPSEVTEILVVENGEPDDTRSICRAHQGPLPLRYHYIPEPGKSNALNTALNLTEAELVIQFDDDIRVDPGTVETFVDGASKYGPGHYFGGPLVPRYEGVGPSEWLRPWLTTCAIGWDLGEREQPHHEFLGANWAAFRSDMVEVGGFIVELGPGAGNDTVGEEVEMQERLAERGRKGIYLPNARVQHHVRQEQCTLRWLRKRWSRHGLSQVLLSPRHLDAPMLAGVPRFLWRSWLTAFARTVPARLASPHSDRRMRLELELALVEGRMRGYRSVRGRGGLRRREAKG